MSKLKDVWASGNAAVNGWLSLPGSHLAEVMAHQGWDSLTIDLQHSSIDVGAAVPMLQAMAASDVTPIVRVPWNEPSVMMRVLDAGARHQRSFKNWLTVFRVIYVNRCPVGVSVTWA